MYYISGNVIIAKKFTEFECDVKMSMQSVRVCAKAYSRCGNFQDLIFVDKRTNIFTELKF